MRWFLVPALALTPALLPGLAFGQAPAGGPVIRTTADPAKGIVIGQPVRIDVEVLFPGEMVRPPRVAIAEAAGAQILRFETQATTMRDRIGDQDYVGQSFEFVLFPRRGGEIAVPAPEVTLLDRNGDPVGAAKGEPLRIAVTVPPGLDPSGPVLAADAVSVTQSWSPDPLKTSFKPGSALVREIRRQAAGVPALGMAEFAFAAPEGVRVYVDPPVVEDRSNRGSVEGHRTDKVTYVFEKPGHYELPALTQPWWSLSSKQARTETLPGVAVTIAAAAGGADARSGLMAHPAWLAAGLVLAALVLAGILLRARIAALWREAVARHRASEKTARRALLRAAEAGDAAAAYRALAAWLGSLPAAEGQRMRSQASLAQAIARLEQALFGNGPAWDHAGAAAFAQAVRGVHRQRGSQPQGATDPLPPLNPFARTGS